MIGEIGAPGWSPTARWMAPSRQASASASPKGGSNLPLLGHAGLVQEGTHEHGDDRARSAPSDPSPHPRRSCRTGHFDMTGRLAPPAGPYGCLPATRWPAESLDLRRRSGPISTTAPAAITRIPAVPVTSSLWRARRPQRRSA